MLIALSECGLQTLVTTLRENNELSLNARKRKVVVFERNKERMGCKINLIGKILEAVN